MPKKKITELPLAQPLSGGEWVPIVQDGETRRFELADLKPYINPAGIELEGHRATSFSSINGDQQVLTPEGIREGELLIGLYATQNRSGYEPYASDSGWTAFSAPPATSGSLEPTMRAWWRIATAEEPEFYTFGKGGSTTNTVGIIMRFSGVHASPVTGGSAKRTEPGESMTFDDFEALAGGQLLYLMNIRSTTITPSFDLDTLQDFTESYSGGRVYVARADVGETGFVGAKTLNYSGSADAVGILSALRPS